ncbi:MAG: Gfo/Idh/MocA family oxidoreductase [Bacteroidales bacterium]|nr:Gfo/Idh/MocA family oxidoreductase [Bacteroidales bacterium]
MIRIGIICPSEIAFRRFMPALQQATDIEFAGIAYANPEEWFGDTSLIDPKKIDEQQERERSKAQNFINSYGGTLYKGYQKMIEAYEIDAVYIPLPPALHFKWAKTALEKGKHVFVEKPSSTNLADTDALLKIADEKGLAIHENYMFVFHNQLKVLDDVVKNGEIGDVRLYRISFGFPRRTQNDFRYNKALGGGALLDAGGYTMKYASYLLGDTAKIVTANANYLPEFDVDMYGSATMVNADGLTAQLAFGMDNDYKCEVEIWGSKGTITSSRILTAPAGFVPSYSIKKNQEIEIGNMPADDAFLKSILQFVLCIKDIEVRKKNYEELHHQEFLVERFKELNRI